jgi:glycosyltransferase involved in cell wall biosynthesis
MSIKLSVCVTSYKRPEMLDLTLESLAGQTRLPDELVISDDASPEDPANIVEKWRRCFPEVRYHRNPDNLNMPGNLNVAVALARGEYVANLHHADVFAPSLLEDWEYALDKYPTAGFVFCGLAGWHVRRKYTDGIILHDVQPLTPGREFFEKHFLHKFSSIVWGTVMARRSAYTPLLPFDKAFEFISDVDMWMRMCLQHDIAYVRKPLIVLDGDHSPSKWGQPGLFNWRLLALSCRIQEANIARFFAGNPDRLRAELRRHDRAALRVYLKCLLGRLGSLDWRGMGEGVRSYRQLRSQTAEPIVREHNRARS